MFNPMTQAELIAAMGRTARDAARAADPTDPFLRAQLLSVYSASRHAAVELAEFDGELRRFAQAAGVEPGDAGAVGEAVCALLERLRSDPSPQAAASLAAVRAALVVLADREVDLLADVIEGPRT